MESGYKNALASLFALSPFLQRSPSFSSRFCTSRTILSAIPINHVFSCQSRSLCLPLLRDSSARYSCVGRSTRRPQGCHFLCQCRPPKGRASSRFVLLPFTEALLATHTCCPRVVHVTRDNRTSDCIDPVVEEVIEVVEVLVSSLKGSSLSGCDCTAKEIYQLIAITLKVLIIPACSSYAHVM